MSNNSNLFVLFDYDPRFLSDSVLRAYFDRILEDNPDFGRRQEIATTLAFYAREDFSLYELSQNAGRSLRRSAHRR